MKHEKALVGLMIILILGLGCVDTPSKSYTEKGKDIIKNPEVTTTKKPVETIIPIQETPNKVKNIASVANKTVTHGETWNVGGGWVIVIIAIDTKLNPREVWFTLSKYGKKVDDAIKTMGENYSYNTSDKFFSAKISSIAAGGSYKADQSGKLVNTGSGDTDFVLFEDIKYQVD